MNRLDGHLLPGGDEDNETRVHFDASGGLQIVDWLSSIDWHPYVGTALEAPAVAELTRLLVGRGGGELAALMEKAGTDGRVAGIKTADAMLSGLRMKLTELRADLEATRKELGEAVGLLRRARAWLDDPSAYAQELAREFDDLVDAWLTAYDLRHPAP